MRVSCVAGLHGQGVLDVKLFIRLTVKLSASVLKLLVTSPATLIPHFFVSNNLEPLVVYIVMHVNKTSNTCGSLLAPRFLIKFQCLYELNFN